MTHDARAELREKVAESIAKADYCGRVLSQHRKFADAAIAVCLEEAARVVEADPDAGTATRADWTKTIGGHIAAAIRGLIKTD
jgi:hypothetical protein